MAETQTPDALDDDGLSPEVGLELDSLRSVERAALLMLLLGEQQASNIVGYLNPKEVQALGTAMVTVRGGDGRGDGRWDGPCGGGGGRERRRRSKFGSGAAHHKNQIRSTRTAATC